MRILHLTAGAGGMYCGSCLRDNALATELTAQGHDVSLLPVYTPTRTDEPNVSSGQVFLGGINVYLQQNVPLFRRTPELLDRLFDLPAVLRAATGKGVSVEPKDLGDLTVSTLRGEDGFQAKEVRKLVRHLQGLPSFDVVVIPNSLLVGLAPPLRRALRRPVVCTLQGEDLFLDGLPAGHRATCLDLIRSHAGQVDAWIATSDYYSGFMARYLGLDRDAIHTVPLGIHVDPPPPARARPDAPFTVGYFARVAPEKGLHLLAEAYALARRERGLPPSRLRAAGYLADNHREYLRRVEATLRGASLADEFRYEGEVDYLGKVAFLDTLDVLSVPSPYAEPKGLYLLEAMARGVPFVQPAHGAFVEMEAKTGGGLLVPPGDVSALADALVRLQADPAERAVLGGRGAAGVRAHYSAARMAARSVEVFHAALRTGQAPRAAG